MCVRVGSGDRVIGYARVSTEEQGVSGWGTRPQRCSRQIGLLSRLGFRAEQVCGLSGPWNSRFCWFDLAGMGCVCAAIVHARRYSAAPR